MAPKYIWDPGKMEEQRRLIISEMGLTIRNDYDVNGKIHADSDPEGEYRKYLGAPVWEMSVEPVVHQVVHGKTKRLQVRVAIFFEGLVPSTF
jgi:hypothetical protein